MLLVRLRAGDRGEGMEWLVQCAVFGQEFEEGVHLTGSLSLERLLLLSRLGIVCEQN